MSFRNVQSAADAAAYIARLNKQWPERAEVLDLILAQAQRHDRQTLRVLELCCGAGVLAEHLLNGVPNMVYTGIDQSQPLLDAAEETLAQFAPNVTLLRHDLNLNDWYAALVEEDCVFDAVVSMQSLHDLGGEAEVSRIYGVARGLLLPDGIFVNADLIVEPNAELPDNPGRLTVERHLHLLKQFGYQNVSCLAKTGGFGLVVGTCS